MRLRLPAASDPTEIIADWIEFETLRSEERRLSLEDLVRVIRRGGTTDAIAGPGGDAGSTISQRVAEDAFVEIDNRVRACGPDKYPFEVAPGVLHLRQAHELSSYVLLLLLSNTKPTSGHAGTAALFERLCQYAALGYLGGGANGAAAIRFGAPRVAPIARLNDAVDHLCRVIAEGGGCKNRQKANHTGDGELDIVAWRHFPDLRSGKLIAFGQCASGASDWQAKLAKLDGERFCKKWLRDMFVVAPMRLFFVPRRIPPNDWDHAGIDGGILFDRCRIVACLKDVSNDVLHQCEQSVRVLLAKVRHG
jgi:hypothetical protein